MKNRVVYFLLMTLLSVSCCGCGDGTYFAEKMYFKANYKFYELEQQKKEEPPAQQDIDRLIFAFKEITLKYPHWQNCLQAYFKIALLYEMKKDYKSAIKEYELIVKDFSDDIENCANAQRLIANIYELENDWNKAEQLYKKIHEQSPYTVVGVMVPLYLAQQYYRRGQVDKSRSATIEALKFYHEIVVNNPNDILTLSAMEFSVDCYRSFGKLEDAVEFLESVARKYPDCHVELRALYQLAQICNEDLKQKEKALFYYKRILEKYPDEKLSAKAAQEIKKITR